MSKFPLLEQLRADRERVEDEVRAPVYEELARAGQMISALRDAIRRLEAALRDPLIKEINMEVGCSGRYARKIGASMSQW